LLFYEFSGYWLETGVSFSFKILPSFVPGFIWVGSFLAHGHLPEAVSAACIECFYLTITFGMIRTLFVLS